MSGIMNPPISFQQNRHDTANVCLCILLCCVCVCVPVYVSALGVRVHVAWVAPKRPCTGMPSILDSVLYATHCCYMEEKSKEKYGTFLLRSMHAHKNNFISLQETVDSFKKKEVPPTKESGNLSKRLMEHWQANSIIVCNNCSHHHCTVQYFLK